MSEVKKIDDGWLPAMTWPKNGWYWLRRHGWGDEPCEVDMRRARLTSSADGLWRTEMTKDWRFLPILEPAAAREQFADEAEQRAFASALDVAAKILASPSLGPAAHGVADAIRSALARGVVVLRGAR